MEQDSTVIAGLIACCFASTIKPVMGDRTGQFAAALSLDMAQWWKPTVPGYLGRVPKPLIFEAVGEAKGASAAENHNCAQKYRCMDEAGCVGSGNRAGGIRRA